MSTQLVFLLIYFHPFATYKSKSINAEYPVFLPVSMLIVARNEASNLKELLPSLLTQDYPEFEIFILDDHSTDGTSQWLAEISRQFPKIRYLRLTESSGKKSALDTAIRLLSYELVLLTDADCRPASDQWISLMVKHLETKTEVVLGYSPYFKQPGWINELIGLETAFTAILYFSFALRQHAYMGVGRNLLYRKQSLLRHFRPLDHPDLLSGDDDLTINSLSAGQKISIQYDPESWMYSIPKTSWKAWIDQKKRHVGTARYYKTVDQVRLMLYYGSLVLSWILAIVMGFINPWVWVGWLVIKTSSFITVIRPCLNKLGAPLTFVKWLRAEGIYVIGLIHLFPFSTGKKWDKW